MPGRARLRSDPDHAVEPGTCAPVRPAVTQSISLRSMSAALTSDAHRSAVATMLPPSAGNAMIARLLADDTTTAAPGDAVAARITAQAGGGRPLPPDVRAEVESGLGQQLGDVHIHDDAEAAELATQLGARAFTSGQDVFFNTGAYNPATPDGYEVLAHELTHTLQQSAGPVAGRQVSPGLSVSEPNDRDEQVAYTTARKLTAARESPAPVEAPSIAPSPAPSPAPRIARVLGQDAPRPVQREAVQRDGDSLLGDLIPDFVLDGIRSAVSAIPGYTMLTQLIGTDPITDQPVHVGRQELIEDLLTYGPFGASVGHLLSTIDVLDDVYSTVSDELAAHNLTLERIGHEIDTAWAELSVSEGIDGNVAMLRRHVNGILDDATAAVSALVDRVIEIVRSVIAEVAEPALQTPEIKPVWDLARKVLHRDPLRGEDVNAPTVEILADFLRLIHEEQRLAQMQERGTLQQAADWLDTQFATFASIGTDLIALFRDAWAAIQPSNLPNLLDTLPALAQRAFALVRRIADFAATVIAKVLELVKQSLLGWLSDHAHEVTGFHLLTVILGRNPFTGVAVPRTAENLIRGFITLLPGGEATYNQLAESGVIGEAATKIEGVMARLGITWELIVSTFRGIWDGLTLNDLLNPLGAFDRILDQFGEPLSKLVQFVAEVIQVVITLILRLMNFPSDLLGSIIDNAMAAIEDIKRDPVAFLTNMLLALKNGFLGFLDEILTFLVQGLSAWLFRGLGQVGITVPADVSLQSILTLVVQVLGVSVDMLWQKLGKHLGEDKAAMLRAGIDRVQGAWAFLRDVQQHGVPAIWTYVVDQLGNLWDTIIGMARDWIMTEIVQAVTARLISMLDPTGVMAVIRSVQALFNAIQSGIEYLRDILQIVNEYVTTFAQVAAGNVIPGADKIKMGLAHAIPIAIGFLANQVGIGNIPEKIVEIIGGLRELIDQAIDWLFEQAMRLGAAALNALGVGGADEAPVDPHDHEALATRVIGEMEQGADDSQSYQELRQQKEVQARALEERYTPMLQPGIALTIVFTAADSDSADSVLDFDVVIAPNTTRKRGKIKTRTIALHGDMLFVDSKQFRSGDLLQVKHGGGWYEEKSTIVGFEIMPVAGGPRIWIKMTGPSTGLFADTYGQNWREPIPGMDELPPTRLAAENAKEDWGNDRDLARKILNYRYHEKQTINPTGKEWEHIVEHKAGGANSSDNLALTSEDVNKRLNNAFSERKRWPELALEDITELTILREYLADKSYDVKLMWKKRVYASEEFRVALRWENRGRGKFQVLE